MSSAATSPSRAPGRWSTSSSRAASDTPASRPALARRRSRWRWRATPGRRSTSIWTSARARSSRWGSPRPRPPGGDRVHQRHRRRGVPAGGRRGLAGAGAARGAHRRPAAAAAGHRRQPDDRPGGAVRQLRAGHDRTPLPWPDDGATWRHWVLGRCARPQPGRPGRSTSTALRGAAVPLAARPLPWPTPARYRRSHRSHAHAASSDVEQLATLFSSRSEGSWSSGPRPSHPSLWWEPRRGWGGPWSPSPPRGCASRECSRRGKPWSVTPGGSSDAAPRVIVQVGATPTTRREPGVRRHRRRSAVVDDDPPRPRPGGTRVGAHPRRPRAPSPPRSTPPRDARAARGWHRAWHAADARARAALDEFLDEIDEPFEPRIARDVAAWIPTGATLFVGNSTPIRDLDLAMAPRTGDPGPGEPRRQRDRRSRSPPRWASPRRGRRSRCSAISRSSTTSARCCGTDGRVAYPTWCWWWCATAAARSSRAPPGVAARASRTVHHPARRRPRGGLCGGRVRMAARRSGAPRSSPRSTPRRRPAAIQVVEVVVDAALGLTLRTALKDRVAASLA